VISSRIKIAQSAVLGYRWTKAGPQMMLVTSKGTRRWVVPKGGVKSGLKAHESAAYEAFEEAGILGRVSRRCVGVYGYHKTNHKQGAYCTVKVYPMKVTDQLPDWPERRLRRREWVSFTVAAARVREKDLKKIIQSFHRALAD
jgi:8-oxo-dGTP pyrophosphatase MutT (NUDIX family)